MARASFFLHRTDQESIRRRQLKNGVTLLLILLVDCACACVLYFTREKRLGEIWSELANLTSAETFKDGTGDLLALFAARLVLLTFAGTAAVYLGQQRNKGPPPPPRGARASNFSSRDASQADLTLRAPLLAPDDHDEDRVCPAVHDASPAGVTVDDAPNDPGAFDPNDFAPTEEDQFHNQRAIRRRDIIVESTFLLCIAMQAYVAVKSVSFYYAEGKTARTVLLLAASIVAINAESVYLRSYVAACTVRTGVLRRDFHAHELQFHDRVVGAVERLLERHAGGTVVAVCHGGVVDRVFRSLLSMPMTGDFALHTLNTSLTEFLSEPDGPWRLIRYNDTAHLVGLPAESTV